MVWPQTVLARWLKARSNSIKKPKRSPDCICDAKRLEWVFHGESVAISSLLVGELAFFNLLYD